MIRTFAGKSPKIHKTAFVHDSSEVIGEVAIGRDASLWPGAVLRGDVAAIRIGERSNLQDCAVVHGRENRPAVIGKGVTVGHSAIVHGAVVGDYSLVGMGAVVMEAVIGKECLIAAGAVVTPGFKAPPRSMIMGMPAKVARRLRPEEIKHLHDSERGYVELSKKHAKTSKVVFG